MKKILHYVNKMNRGGMEQYIMNIYRNIDRNEYQFHFAVHTDQESDFDSEIKELGGKIIVFPSFRKNPVKYRKIWNEFWKLNKENYYAFHYHNNSLANIESVKAANQNSFRNIIIHAHSSFADKGKIQKIHNLFHFINQKWVIKKNIKSVATSEEAANWVFGNRNPNVNILFNGIDYNDYKFNKNSRKNKRKELNIEKDFVIGHVGNFNAVKNHDFLLETFLEILKIQKNSKLLLLGTGLLQDDIQEKAEKLKISEKIIFTGNIPNVSDYLSAMDSFVFPSKFEGLGLAAVEAQINGLPVIYANTVPQIIEITDKCIRLDLEDSPTVWAQNINEQRNLQRTSLELNLRFSIDNIMKEIVALYNKN